MPVDPDLAPLVGTWRLVSAGATFTDNGERIETWGRDPDGRMMLAPGGRIIFIFTRRNRRPATNDSERITLFNELLSYTGMVRLDGPGRFITTVEVAKDPADVGKEWLRQFTLDGDRLVIRLPEQTNQFSLGRMAVFDAVFIRENP